MPTDANYFWQFSQNLFNVNLISAQNLKEVGEIPKACKPKSNIAISIFSVDLNAGLRNKRVRGEVIDSRDSGKGWWRYCRKWRNAANVPGCSQPSLHGIVAEVL